MITLKQRIRNLWRLSSLELWESWDEHGYLDKKNVKHLVAKNETNIEFPKEEKPKMAKIIKRKLKSIEEEVDDILK
jgi:hypothetical protein